MPSPHIEAISTGNRAALQPRLTSKSRLRFVPARRTSPAAAITSASNHAPGLAILTDGFQLMTIVSDKT